MAAASGCVVPVDSAARDSTISTTTDPVVEEGRAELFGPEATRYVVQTRRSRLAIGGHDTVLGDHSLTFDRWSATIDASSIPMRMHFEIDVASLRSNEALVASIVRNHLLEVDKYGRATLDGTISPTKTPGLVAIDGTATIHGRSNPLHFTGRLRQDGAGYRFEGELDISRHAYDLVHAPAEPFLDDRFHISVAAVALPEPVGVMEEPVVTD